MNESILVLGSLTKRLREQIQAKLNSDPPVQEFKLSSIASLGGPEWPAGSCPIVKGDGADPRIAKELGMGLIGMIRQNGFNRLIIDLCYDHFDLYIHPDGWIAAASNEMRLALGNDHPCRLVKFGSSEYMPHWWRGLDLLAAVIQDKNLMPNVLVSCALSDVRDRDVRQTLVGAEFTTDSEASGVAPIRVPTAKPSRTIQAKTGGEEAGRSGGQPQVPQHKTMTPPQPEQPLSAKRRISTARSIACGTSPWLLIEVAAIAEEGEGDEHKGGLLDIIFSDQGGQPITGPVDGCSSSARYPNYLYIPVAGAGQDRRASFIITRPLNAVRCDVRLHDWACRVNHSDFHASCSIIEAAWDDLMKLTRKSVASVSLIERLIIIGRSRGRLDDLSELLTLAAAMDMSKRSNIEAMLHVQAEKTELSAGWMPTCPPLNSRRRTDDERIRVCHLHKTAYPFESSGGSIRGFNTVKSQKMAGIDAYMILPPGYPGGAITGQANGAREQDGVEMHVQGADLPGIRTLTPIRRNELACRHIASVIDRRGADIIHASSGVRGYELALQGLSIGGKIGIPVIYEVRSFHEHTWGPMFDGIMECERTKKRMQKEDECMRMADHVVTIAEEMRLALVKRGVPESKIDVIPNAVDDLFLQGEVEPVRYSKLHGAQVVVGYISNMSKREGHVHLLRAIHRLRSGGMDARGLMVGDGPEREALQREAGALGLDSMVEFTGAIDHASIKSHYCAIDVFVVPRVPDYAADFVTPLKPFEAMAMKRPLIVSDLPALREIVGRSERGILAPPGDPEGIAQGVRQLVENKKLYDSIATAGCEWVRKERTWSANARRYRQIYDMVMTEHASNPRKIRNGAEPC